MFVGLVHYGKLDHRNHVYIFVYQSIGRGNIESRCAANKQRVSSNKYVSHAVHLENWRAISAVPEFHLQFRKRGARVSEGRKGRIHRSTLWKNASCIAIGASPRKSFVMIESPRGESMKN